MNTIVHLDEKCGWHLWRRLILRWSDKDGWRKVCDVCEQDRAKRRWR